MSRLFPAIKRTLSKRPSAGPLIEALEDRKFRSVTSFAVNTSQSTLTLSGYVTNGFFTAPLQPQVGVSAINASEDSLTTHLIGSIVADVAANTLQILGDTALTARVNGQWQPGSNPDGSLQNFLAKEDSNFGVLISTGAADEFVAARNLSFSLSSLNLTNTGSGYPVTGPLLSIATTSGKVFYDGFSLGIQDLSGGPGANNEATTLATLVTNGGTQTLTVPVATTLTTNVGGLTSVITYTGQVVATRAVPEPTLVGAVFIGGSAMLLRRRARSQAKPGGRQAKPKTDR